MSKGTGLMMFSSSTTRGIRNGGRTQLRRVFVFRILLMLLVLLLAPAAVVADHPTATWGPILITVILPDGEEHVGEFTKDQVYEVLEERPLPHGLYVDAYKIDWWIYAALNAFELPFKVETTGSTGSWRSTIISIGPYANDAERRWVHDVNGIRSRYAVNGHGDEGVERIVLRFERSNTTKRPR